MPSKARRPVCGLAAFVLSVGLSAAEAGTGTLTAQAAVDTSCTVATTALDFGPYDPILANATASLDNGTTASVTIACVKDTTATIGLGNGNNFSGVTRQMQHKTITTATKLAYALYQPPSNAPGTPCVFPASTPWTSTSVLTAPAATNRNSRTFNVCGTVPAGQDVEVGDYADTVVVTVNF